jgi:hypothetical protein
MGSYVGRRLARSRQLPRPHQRRIQRVHLADDIRQGGHDLLLFLQRRQEPLAGDARSE